MFRSFTKESNKEPNINSKLNSKDKIRKWKKLVFLFKRFTKEKNNDKNI